MVEKWSLRLRIFLFFALIGLGAVAIVAAGMVLAVQRIGEDAVQPLVLFGGGAGFAIAGLSLWVWLKFDENVARPIDRLARDMRAIAHGRATGKVDDGTARHLGLLAPAVKDVTLALSGARSEIDKAIREATNEVELQKARLEAVVRDLQEAVLICTLDHKILLYNRRALEILHISGDLGLGRSLFEVLSAQPFRHALERLTVRLKEARHHDHDEGLSTLVMSTTADGQHTLRGRMSLLLDPVNIRPVGYVATFSDATQELAEHARRDRLLYAATVDMRRPAASLRAAAEMLTSDGDIGDEGRHAFERILVDEATALSDRLQQLETESRDLLAGAWPMSDVFSTTLFHCVLDKRTPDQVACRMVGEPLWLHGDSLTLVELLDHLIGQLEERRDADDLTLQATPGRGARSGHVYLELGWRGDIVPCAELDRWITVPLNDELGGITGRDILDRHKTELWCEAVEGGRARLRLPLPAGKQHQRNTPQKPLPERPEFYDFDLLGRIDPAAIVDTPLRALTYVVFDTETTGLEPSAGDEIVSVAGLRIVNGRLLRGEIFDQLVNPNRPIPDVAAKVHGISNAMVERAPAVDMVLPRFKKFVGDAVLVAHNAAFDMKFLTLKQEVSGVRFDNPVLDTVLLAAHVHGTDDSLTLDSLAERYGIALPEKDRHTALGNSMATAEVFLRLVDLLDQAGIRTLRDAIQVSKKMVAIRRQQAKY